MICKKYVRKNFLRINRCRSSTFLKTKKDHICKNMKSMLSSAWRRDEVVNHLNEGIVGTMFFGSNCEHLPIRPIEISSESHNRGQRCCNRQIKPGRCI